MKAPDHPQPSGDRRMGRLLMAALREAGHSVHIACHLRSWDPGLLPGRQQRLAALGERAAASLVRRWQGQSHAPDLWFTYHLYHKAPDDIGPKVSKILGIPYVVAEASVARRQENGKWAVGYRGARHALAHANRVVALTQADVPGLSAIVPPHRLCYLPPFLDTRPYANALMKRSHAYRQLGQRWRLPPDAVRLVTVAMMRHGDKLASWRALARALKQLSAPHWVMIAIGDGPARSLVHEAFADLPPDQLRWLGLVDSAGLPEILAGSDVFVWPGINEAYGMALLEAQATGLPAVAGRTGGVGDIVDDGETAILVTPGDDKGFASAVEHLMTHPALHQHMGHAASARAARLHDIADASRRLDAILRQAATQDKP